MKKDEKVIENEISVVFGNNLEIENKGSTSIDMKRNAKGITEFVIKIYNNDIKEALKEAKSAYNLLDKQYPYSE